MRYVAVLESDYGTRVFGGFASAASANEFAEKVNARLVRAEDGDFADWDARKDRDPDELPSVGFGRVYVYPIIKPTVTRAAGYGFGLRYYDEAGVAADVG
jgi:hypothetical protein